MSTSLLLPNGYKRIGWCFLIAATLVWGILLFFDFERSRFTTKVFSVFPDQMAGQLQPFNFMETDITITAAGVLFIAGAIFVSFSKEKKEDEFIARLRLSSMLWAVWVNYIFLLLSSLFVYGTAFLAVMMYNMFTIPVIFIIRFNYLLYRSSKAVKE